MLTGYTGNSTTGALQPTRWCDQHWPRPLQSHVLAPHATCLGTLFLVANTTPIRFSLTANVMSRHLCRHRSPHQDHSCNAGSMQLSMLRQGSWLMHEPETRCAKLEWRVPRITFDWQQVPGAPNPALETHMHATSLQSHARPYMVDAMYRPSFPLSSHQAAPFSSLVILSGARFQSGAVPVLPPTNAGSIEQRHVVSAAGSAAAPGSTVVQAHEVCPTVWPTLHVTQRASCRSRCLTK